MIDYPEREKLRAQANAPGMTCALDAIERAAFKAGVEAMAAEVLRRQHKPGTVGHSAYSEWLSFVVQAVLAQLDKEAPEDGKADH